MRAVDTRQSPNPSGAKIGATKLPIIASRLCSGDSATLNLASKVCKNQIIIDATKIIVNANKNTIKTANEIVLNAEGTYTSVDKENKIEEAESKIELKETETSAKLEINKTEL